MNYVMTKASSNMNIIFICIVTLLLTTRCNGHEQDHMNETDVYLSSFIADLWLEGADIVRIIWRDCSKKLIDVKDVIDHKEYFPKFLRCMKRKTLRALDRSLSPDVVPIADGVNLVRFELVDSSGNIMSENGTSSWSEKELEEGEWRTLALQRMAKVLRTHVIKFDFNEEKTMAKVEFRGRRRHQMLTMMMFGVVSIGMVLVPMGFQFLAVLGGKALLLAKMALILASIQGLKKVDNYDGYLDRGKIAASPLNYGFYHNYLPYDHYPEKRSQDNWSHSVLMPATTQSSNSIHSSRSKLEMGGIKVDRVHIAETDNIKVAKRATDAISKPNERNVQQYTRQILIYPSLSSLDVPAYNPLDEPSPEVDLTTSPGEVQADYTLDLPYNGLRFQNPTTIIST